MGQMLNTANVDYQTENDDIKSGDIILCWEWNVFFSKSAEQLLQKS